MRKRVGDGEEVRQGDREEGRQEDIKREDSKGKSGRDGGRTKKDQERKISRQILLVRARADGSREQEGGKEKDSSSQLMKQTATEDQEMEGVTEMRKEKVREKVG